MEDQSLVNWMGFPSEGAEAIFQRLSTLRDKGSWPSIPVGFNLGKNKDTPQEDAPLDYALAAGRLATLADFFVINVSSPNTEKLRDLQGKAALSALFTLFGFTYLGVAQWGIYVTAFRRAFPAMDAVCALPFRLIDRYSASH